VFLQQAQTIDRYEKGQDIKPAKFQKILVPALKKTARFPP
jgi:hypothetical protein